MTSIYIHISPALICFAIRWFPATSTIQSFATEDPPTWLYSLLVPWLFFVAHQVVYFIIVQIICKSHIESTNGMTVFKWLFRKKDGNTMYHVISACGPQPLCRVLAFGVWYGIQSFIRNECIFHYFGVVAAIVAVGNDLPGTARLPCWYSCPVNSSTARLWPMRSSSSRSCLWPRTMGQTSSSKSFHASTMATPNQRRQGRQQQRLRP